MSCFKTSQAGLKVDSYIIEDEKNQFGYIYCTTNLINGKIYVGQHKGCFSKTYLGSGTIFKKALKKYGKENFIVESIDYAKTQKELNQKESSWILEYGDSIGWDNMYNILKFSDSSYKGKLLRKEVIRRFKAVHKNKYNYKEFKYGGMEFKIDIHCERHGVFKQTISAHLSGQGCKTCAYEKNGKLQALSLEEVLFRFTKTHGNKYDYSKMIYRRCTDKVEIICPIHGTFFQKPMNHFICGCNKCGYLKFKKGKPKPRKHIMSVHEFIVKANIKHDSKYDYSQVQFTRISQDKIKIICPLHGEFLQTPKAHLKGQMCKKCSDKNTGKLLSKQISFKIENVIYHYPSIASACKDLSLSRGTMSRFISGKLLKYKNLERI